jgi:hypothetical protein
MCALGVAEALLWVCIDWPAIVAEPPPEINPCSGAWQAKRR